MRNIYVGVMCKIRLMLRVCFENEVMFIYFNSVLSLLASVTLCIQEILYIRGTCIDGNYIWVITIDRDKYS